MAYASDMTRGKPLPLLLRFSVPLLVSNVLMVLYTFADSAIVGRMLGVEAFAAVGATGMLYFMIFSIGLGLGQGFGIVLAQRFGAKNMSGLRKGFVTGIYLMILIGAVIGAAGIIWSRQALEILGTPQELMTGAYAYLIWTLGGISITFLSVYMGGVLRAIGNSKTPMIAMIVSSLVNIVLNLVLVRPFGIQGIAAATLTAQLVSCVHCFIILRKSGLFDGSGIIPDKQSGFELLRIGLPLGLRNCVIQSGGVLVQWFVNGYNDIALIGGIAVAKRMYSLVLVAGSAFDAANATFIAQNFGAGDYKRMKHGFATARRLFLVSAVIIMALLIPFVRQLLGLLFDGDPDLVAATLNYGTLQLTIILAGLPLLHMLFLYRSTLEGIGKPLIPVLSGFVELLMRIFSLIILTPVIDKYGILVSDSAGWVGAVVLLATAYYIIMRRMKPAATGQADCLRAQFSNN